MVLNSLIEIVGGAVPREYIGAVEKGAEAQMESWCYCWFPMVDVGVELHFDGSYHDVDSNEMAFSIAAGMGV